MADWTVEGGTSRTNMLSSLTRISWAGVFAGAISALAIIITLNLLAVWVDAGGPMGLGAGIWFVISSLMAFFVGGWIAAHLSGIPNKDTGRLHGFVSWSLACLSLFVMALYLGTSVSGSGWAASRMSGVITGGDVGKVGAITFVQLIIGAFFAVLGGSVGTPDSILAISAPVQEMPTLTREEPPRRIA